MDSISDLYDKISEIGGKSVNRWIREVRKRLLKFSKNISSASPFKDKPTYQKDFRKGRFWISTSTKDSTVKMFGTAPNAGRVKGFGAPVDKWHSTKPYVFKYPEKGTIFGRSRTPYGRGWVTYGKAQDTSRDAGIPLKTAYYGGSPVKLTRFFGIKGLGYGRTKDGKAVPIYYESAFVDWMMSQHDDEIGRIIMEAGQDVISQSLRGKR